MDFFEDIIPILIFILIPVIRGINSSKKQKKEYQKKLGSRPQGQGGSPHRSSSSQTRRLQPWRELIDEIGREFKKAIEEETNKKKPIKKDLESYSEKPQGEPRYSIENKTEEELEPFNYFEEEPLSEDRIYSLNAIKDGIEDTQEEAGLPVSSLEFSSNPILQGLIFSEILGPPRSRQRR